MAAAASRAPRDPSSVSRPRKGRLEGRVAPVPLPPRKPMARAVRLSVFHRRVQIELSPTALELLWAAMKVTSEGGLDGDRWSGSTMITVDLARLTHQLSDTADAHTAHRVASLAPADPRVRQRARQVAFAEAARLATGALIQPTIDLKARASGSTVHFALDVEALLRR